MMARWVEMEDGNLVNLDHISTIWIFERKSSDGEKIYNVTLCGSTENYIVTSNKSYEKAKINREVLMKNIDGGFTVIPYEYIGD